MSGITPERRERHRRAAEALTRAGIAFEARHDGAHLLVEHNGLRVELAAGSGEWWLTEAHGYRSKGIKELIRFLTERPDKRQGMSLWWYAGDTRCGEGLYSVITEGTVSVARCALVDLAEANQMPVNRMPGRWARAINPLTGEAL